MRSATSQSSACRSRSCRTRVATPSHECANTASARSGRVRPPRSGPSSTRPWSASPNPTPASSSSRSRRWTSPPSVPSMSVTPRVPTSTARTPPGCTPSSWIHTTSIPTSTSSGSHRWPTSSSWSAPVSPPDRTPGWLLHRCELHRHVLDAVDEVHVQPFDRAGQLHVGQDAAQFLEHAVDLVAREVGAEAEVRAATTEGDVVVRLAGDVEHMWGRELVGIAVGGRVPERDLVAVLDRNAADLGVTGRGAPEVVDGTHEPEHLLDCRRAHVGLA